MPGPLRACAPVARQRPEVGVRAELVAAELRAPLVEPPALGGVELLVARTRARPLLLRLDELRRGCLRACGVPSVDEPAVPPALRARAVPDAERAVSRRGEVRVGRGGGGAEGGAAGAWGRGARGWGGMRGFQ